MENCPNVCSVCVCVCAQVWGFWWNNSKYKLIIFIIRLSAVRRNCHEPNQDARCLRVRARSCGNRGNRAKRLCTNIDMSNVDVRWKHAHVSVCALRVHMWKCRWQQNNDNVLARVCCLRALAPVAEITEQLSQLSNLYPRKPVTLFNFLPQIKSFALKPLF